MLVKVQPAGAVVPAAKPSLSSVPPAPPPPAKLLFVATSSR